MTKKKDMTYDYQEKLKDARHMIRLYSLEELMAMFECGRMYIDMAINSGKLKHISPNFRDRYIYLADFLEYMEKERRAHGKEDND